MPNKNVKVLEDVNIVKEDSLSLLIDKALGYNDSMAYNQVASYHLLNNMGERFLLTALKMANKYNNAEACYHVYCIIAYSTPQPPKDALEKMDTKTRNLAFFYLLKSYEMQYESSKFEVMEIFGEDKAPPKSSYYW
ncbi:MAG: hypothetical protein EOO85_25605 [Pedobacter sp.]|nr:MAG: hypothetical protein EOO85_25605 [Pedobacter sp.]